MLTETEVIDALLLRFPQLTRQGALNIMHAVGKETAHYLTVAQTTRKLTCSTCQTPFDSGAIHCLTCQETFCSFTCLQSHTNKMERPISHAMPYGMK
jgi:hypothetical protein